jgi:3-oxoadipate enol-lactonase
MPFVGLHSARIHYEIAGSADAPVLVLSNSLGADLSMWEPQAVRFFRRFRLLRYDTRGHGRSEVTPGPYNIAQLSGDVLELLDSLEVAAAHFCGLSMGGLIGQWIAVHAPHRLIRLVLANTAAKIGSAESWNARIEAVETKGMSAIAEPVLQRWFTPAFRLRAPEVVARFGAMLERCDPVGYAANCAAVRDMDLRESICAIGLPVLIVNGAHDSATPPEQGRFLAKSIPGAKYVELQAAHLSNVEAADEFSECVVDFLGQ